MALMEASIFFINIHFVVERQLIFFNTFTQNIFVSISFLQCYVEIKFCTQLFAFHRCAQSRISGITMHSVSEKKGERSSVKSELRKCRGFAAGIISILRARSFILPEAMLRRREVVRLRSPSPGPRPYVL